MSRPTRWLRSVRQCLVAVAVGHLGSAAWALNLSPNPLILTAFGQAELTVGISAPQAFPVVVTLTVAPAGLLEMPGVITIPTGFTWVTTQVRAVVDAGNASITGILGGDSATIEVIIGTADACSVASTEAVAAANNYIIKVQAMEPACRVQGKACNKAVSAANTSLKVLTASNKAVAAACKE